jgi:uncharacterized protein involved in exopolysaccharide biosynthesis
MESEAKTQAPKFSDYLYVLYKWKKFLFINLFVVALLAGTYAFLLPKQYKATSTIMIPPENTMGLGGLASLVSGKSGAASIGSKLLGLSNSSEDLLLGILNSRTTLMKVVEKFDLWNYYEITDKNTDKILKAFVPDLTFGPNEFSMIEISVTNKDPELSAEIANYFVAILDSTNIKINIEQATNSRKFIETRYTQNLDDLKNAEDTLYKFQKRYGIVAVPEQLEVSIKAAAEFEAQLARKEMESYFMKQAYGENSPQYLGTMAEYNLIKNKILELKNSTQMSSVSNVLFPFKNMPDISIKYLRYYREVEIQQSILEVILPLYEQAKVEEQKSIPTIMILDKAVPPQLKYSPKRATIIIGITFLFAFILIPFVFVGEKLVRMSEFSNPMQDKGARFFLRLNKIYRMKY